VTTRKRVLVICPVNVLQNWNNEFEKWLPKEDPLTGLPIRDWELFLLGDAVKSFEARAKLVADWHREGGVLLLGYEMFRLLIQREDGSQSSVGGGARGRKGRKLQQERSVWDLQEGLAKLCEEDRRKIAQKEELGRGIREALLSPGPDLVICDEGHRIKNLNTEVANALSAINTKSACF
jgi:RAD54-like protein 2